MRVDKKVLYERLMIFFAAIVQCIGFVISIVIEDFSKSFLPHFEIIVPIANISCSLICLYLVLFPKVRILQSAVLFIQGIILTLNNMIFLGIFLYCFGISLLFCYGYLKTKKQQKLIFSVIPLFLTLFAIIPTSASTFFMALAYTLFLLFSYIHLYNCIKSHLFDLFPFLSTKISTAILPTPGNIINFSEYGLSERQEKIIKEFLKDETNYKQLAETFITSESTIKQEMKRICKIFGVENAAMLKLLFKQYNIA